MGRPKGTTTTTVVAVRLDEELVAEIDTMVDEDNTRMRREFSVGYATRASAVRVLLTLGLEHLKASKLSNP